MHVTITFTARRNLSPSVGVDDLVVVETEDAILITTRERSQDVRRVVSELAGKHDELI